MLPSFALCSSSDLLSSQALVFLHFRADGWWHFGNWAGGCTLFDNAFQVHQGFSNCLYGILPCPGLDNAASLKSRTIKYKRKDFRIQNVHRLRLFPSNLPSKTTAPRKAQKNVHNSRQRRLLFPSDNCSIAAAHAILWIMNTSDYLVLVHALIMG